MLDHYRIRFPNNSNNSTRFQYVFHAARLLFLEATKKHESHPLALSLSVAIPFLRSFKISPNISFNFATGFAIHRTRRSRAGYNSMALSKSPNRIRRFIFRVLQILHYQHMRPVDAAVDGIPVYIKLSGNQGRRVIVPVEKQDDLI